MSGNVIDLRARQAAIGPQPAASGQFRTSWESRRGLDGQNCEKAAELRAVVLPIFRQAGDWAELQRRLARKGFGLVFLEGRMVLTDIATGRAICTGTFLGMPLARLASRLGRPQIVALPGGHSGNLLH